MKDYRRRIADAVLADKLAGKGAVLIEGPKWCGKTTTAEQLAKSVLYMADPDLLNEIFRLPISSQVGFLRAQSPVFWMNGRLPRSFGMPFVSP